MTTITTFGTVAQNGAPAQQPSPMPFHRYRAFEPVDVPDRAWPTKKITHAPRWLTTDLRDGNQALIDPMTPARKMKMFDLLVKLGYKEIEVGFPSASQTDFDFVRKLIVEDRIPDDVQISVLTQAREDLISRTAEALVGVQRANIHLYNATAELFRRVVFGIDEAQCIAMATRGTELVMKYAEQHLGDVEFGYQYSPEIFTQTPTEFAVEVCNRVSDVWQPDAGREIIFNLPATVEMSTPNTYADQIEYFIRNIRNREHVCVSLHPHNDRGTAVAATELALMAGADRVEGCLFGHGERTGNVDLVTLAMNLFSQGIDPQVDFSDIDEVRRTVEYCTGIQVHPRHPYAGDLVYTAFSGSHQDAIKKGLEALAKKAAAAGQSIHEVDWEAPYLPIDPHDVGRTYEAVVRVNSQSGKGGIAYLLSSTRHLELPRRLQIELSQIVQKHTEQGGGEITADELWSVFADEYLPASAVEGLQPWGRYALRGTTVTTADEGKHSILTVTLVEDGEEKVLASTGNGPIDAFVAALSEVGADVKVLDYTEHALSEGGDAIAASYVECEIGGQVLWGVGIDPSTITASFKAIVSALNRAVR